MTNLRQHRPWPHRRTAAWAACAALLAASVAGPAHAAEPWAACFDQAASRHGVNSDVLRAIAEQESNGRPHAMGRNPDGSRDIGLMQINTGWLPELARHGVSESMLWDGCTNIFVGAWILAKRMQGLGNSWRAIGAYHSSTPELNARYAWRIHRRLNGDTGSVKTVASATR